MPTPPSIPPNFANESELQAYCVKYAEGLGAVCWLIKKANTRGVPDLYMGFCTGVSIWVEFKHPNGTGKIGPTQKRRHAELRERKIPVYVCASFETFREIIAPHWRH